MNSIVKTAAFTALFIVGGLYVFRHLRGTSKPGYANAAPHGGKVRSALSSVPGTLPNG